MTSLVVSELDAAGVFAALLSRTGEAAPQPRLSATRRALELLGDPHARFPSIHITGTNGKTSTSRMAAELLRHRGLRVGLFTSPHLTRFAERIAIDGVPVADGVLATEWQRIRSTLARVDDELSQSGEPSLSFFEALTVLAFQVFASVNVQAAVIEVGMGGEWDSTNVVDGRVAVFAPISLDHTRQLGSTLEEIARTKSGIIKPGSTVVTAAQPEGALDEIMARANSVGSPVLAADRDFGGIPLSPTSTGQEIALRRIDGSSIPRTALSLHGDHQASNAALALAAVDSFLSGPAMTPAAVSAALAHASSPGRLQVIGHDPLVILDAAHNPAGARSLAAAMRDWPGVRRVSFVLGVLEEKDVVGIVEALRPVASDFYVTQSDSVRAIGHRRLAGIVAEAATGITVRDFAYPSAALAAAREGAAGHPNVAIVITGSITLIGEALDRATDRGPSMLDDRSVR
jgi:dihydrofolate synthase/folylpolyglutamate synthase